VAALPRYRQTRPAGLVSSASLTLATRVAALLFSLATNVILARALGPDGRGVFAVAVLIPALIGLFAQLGIGQANLYYLSKGLIGAEELVGHSMTLGALFGGLCFAGVLVYVQGAHSARLAGIPSQLVVISCAALPFTLVTAFLQGVLNGAQRFKGFNASLLTQYASQTGAQAIVLTIAHPSTLAAVLGWLASAVVSALVTVYCIAPVGRISLQLRMSTLRGLLRFGLIGYLGSLTSFVNYRFDVLLVNVFAGARQVGLYAVGTGLAEVVWYLANAAGIVLAPRVASTGREEGDRITESVCRVVTWLALIGGAMMAVFTPFVVVLFFGAAFAESAWAVWLLLPGIVTFSTARVLSMYLLGRNRLKVDLLASLVGLVITLALDIALIPHLGFRGAAIASSLAYSATMVVDVFWVTRHSTISPAGLFRPRLEDVRVLALRVRQTVRFDEQDSARAKVA
jgi:O-antigen/teichoic acid export membrane protein